MVILKDNCGKRYPAQGVLPPFASGDPGWKLGLLVIGRANAGTAHTMADLRAAKTALEKSQAKYAGTAHRAYISLMLGDLLRIMGQTDAARGAWEDAVEHGGPHDYSDELARHRLSDLP